MTESLYTTKAAIVERLKEIVQNVETTEKAELDALKQNFYKLHRIAQEQARKEYIEQGGDPANFIPAPDEDEIAYKAEMDLIKERRNVLRQEIEEMKKENLTRKQAIIDRIKVLLENPEEANQAYQEVKQLQQQWKEIGSVPAENANELWKNYQLYTEQFYDILKMNIEFREYDFKKNLEIKTRLCEAAEKLTEQEDAVSAFHQLQKLHQEYRDCGPVAKEQREAIWQRFKEASTTINKNYQLHFEQIKATEQQNLERKTALCERIEAINADAPQTAAQWNEKTQTVLDLQQQWKSIGFAPQKFNVKIFERFRAACDLFFKSKNTFYAERKENLAENLKKKIALCEQAEALKESTEWKKTADTLIRLQKEWKTIGAVARKESDAVWQRFLDACNYFFDRKEKATSGQRNEEKENLSRKREIIEKLKALAEEGKEATQQQVRDLMNEWNGVGHVPFKEKDKLYEQYRALVDDLFKSLNLSSGKKRLNRFKENLKDKAGQEGNSLSRDRDRMIRAYEAMKSEIQTYENNLGFLTTTSKKGNGLVAEMNRKVEKLKDELELLRQKIIAIEEQMSE